jgi:hypothetical protein
MTKMRALAALLAVAVAAAFSTVLSTPAHADFDPCPHGRNNPPCVDYLLWNPIRGCDYCPPWALGFLDDAVLPAVDRWNYLEQVREGLIVLGEASIAKQPDVQGLRQQALKKLTAAACTLNGIALKPGPVGRFDTKSGAFEPQPMAWLAGADLLLATGLNQLRCGGDGSLQTFDDALKVLTGGAAQAG